jgi:hypothetical protein
MVVCDSIFPRTLFWFQMSIFIPIFVACAVAIFITWMFGGNITTNSITAWALLPFAFLVASYFGLKDRLFPKLTFAIGRSADQAQYARYWRNLALTSVIIGIFLKLTIDHLLK